MLRARPQLSGERHLKLPRTVTTRLSSRCCRYLFVASLPSHFYCEHFCSLRQFARSAENHRRPEPSIDPGTRSAYSIWQPARWHPGAHLLAFAERNAELARMGNSVHHYLRTHRKTLISAHRRALCRAGFLLRRPFLSYARKDCFCNKVTIIIFS